LKKSIVRTLSGALNAVQAPTSLEKSKKINFNLKVLASLVYMLIEEVYKDVRTVHHTQLSLTLPLQN